MTSEREMLVGDANSPDKDLGIRMKKRPSRVRRALIGLVALLALLVGGGWLFGPRVIASVASRSYAIHLQGKPARVIVEDVHLGWGGPQRVGRLRVEDETGTTLADLSVESTATLIGAYRTRDLGEVTLRGAIDLTEAQLARFSPQDEAIDPHADAPVLTSGSAPRSLDQMKIYLPRRWRGSIKTEELSLSYTGVVGDEPRRIEVEGLDLWASFDGRSEGEMRLESSSPPLNMTLNASSLARRDGLVELDRAKIDLDLSALIPGWIVESLTRAALGDDSASSAARSAMADDAVVQAHLQVRDGRLALSEKSGGVRATIPMPAALAGHFEGGSRGVQWLERPAGRLVIDRLDIPLVGPGGAAWSKGAIAMSIESSVGSVAMALDPEANPQRIEFKPGTLTIASDDLSHGLSVDGKWEVAIGDRAPAGVRIEGRSGSLVSAAGSFVTDVPDDVELSLLVYNVPTSILEPWANRRGLTMENWLGGDAHSRLTIRTVRDEASGGALAADIELEGNTNFSGWWVVARISQDEIFFPGEDSIRVNADNIGPLVRLIMVESDLKLAGSGIVVASASDMRIPMVGGLPNLREIRGHLSVDIGDLVIVEGAGAEPVTVKSLWTEARVSDGRAVAINLDHKIRVGLEDLRARGAIDVRGLLDQSAAEWPWVDLDPAELHVGGSIHVEDVPESLISSFAPRWREAIAQLVGPDLDLTIGFEDTQSMLASATISAKGDAGVAAFANVQVSDFETVHVDGAQVSFTATPALAHEIVAALDDDSLRALALERDARLSIQAKPFAIIRASPDSADSPGWTLSPTDVELQALDDIAVRRDGAGDADALASLAARDLRVQAAVDIHNEMRGAVAISAQLLDLMDGQESSIGSIGASLRNDGQAGWSVAQARLETTSTPSLDRLAGANGVLEQILGDSATIDVSPLDQGLEHVALTIESPRTNGALKLGLLDDRITLDEPTTITSTLAPALVERLFGGDDGQPSTRLASAAPFEMAIGSLAIGRGSRQWLDPQVFELDATFTAPALDLVSASGESISIGSLALDLEGTDEAGAIDLELDTDTLTTESGAVPGPNAALRVHGLADASGDITSRQPRFSGTIGGGAPTALLHEASRARELLVDLLGPAIDVQIVANDLSRTSGHVTASAESPYFSASIAGNPSTSEFAADQRVVATLHRVTPQFSARALERIMPLVDGVEKTTSDEPATLHAEGLVIPLDGDLSRLSGDLEISLGTVRFTTSGLVARLLEASHNRAAGELGRKVEPFSVQIREGVATFADTTIPMGDYDISSGGAIDLVKDELDLVLFIPFYALADDVASGLKAPAGFDDAVQMPFRIQGPSANPKVAFAPDLLPQRLIPAFIEHGAEEVGGETGELIKDAGKVLEGIGRGLFGKKKKEDEPDEDDDDG